MLGAISEGAHMKIKQTGQYHRGNQAINQEVPQ